MCPPPATSTPVVPDDALGRASYFRQASAELAGTDLIFFDPDNGLDIPSKAKGRRDSSKFVYRDEVAATYNAGPSVLVYQHFPREERGAYVRRIAASLRPSVPDAALWAFRTSKVLFFLAAQPRRQEVLSRAAAELASRAGGLFVAVERIE